MSMIKYIDEDGAQIEEGDGWLFIDGVCYAQPGTDEDFDLYAAEVQNGEGYYNEAGKFVWYKNYD